MEVQTFNIEGPKLIKLKRFGDARGFFVERYHQNRLVEIGVPEFFCQDNYSRSAPGVLRGLHYQFDLPQGKLVSCTFGAILDVAVDIRKSSPTYGQHIAVELVGDEPSLFWIPPGFAHGFCVLGDTPADLMYKVNNYYNPIGEGAILWNDPILNIDWPTNMPSLSDKDSTAPLFSEYTEGPKF